MRSRAGTTSIAFLLLLLVTGCSPMTGDATVDKEVTIDEAKTIAQGMEQSLAGLVPAEQVVSCRAARRGTISGQARPKWC